MSFIQSILTLVTIFCNSTIARYIGEERPRVKMTWRDIELSFLYGTGAQRSCMPFKAFKRIYGCTNVKKVDANLNIRDAGGNVRLQRNLSLAHATDGKKDYA